MAQLGLLDPDEPDPVALDNETGSSIFFLTCDHAGRAFPRRLGRLGLPESETLRHIAWDIGIGAVGQRLSRLLDAAVVLQTYSPDHYAVQFAANASFHVIAVVGSKDVAFVRALGETLSIALLGTFTAAVLAFPLGILAAKTVVRHRLIHGMLCWRHFL